MEDLHVLLRSPPVFAIHDIAALILSKCFHMDVIA